MLAKIGLSEIVHLFRKNSETCPMKTTWKTPRNITKKKVNSAVIPLESGTVGHIIESPSFLLPLWLSVFLSASSSLFFFFFLLKNMINFLIFKKLSVLYWSVDD